MVVLLLLLLFLLLLAVLLLFLVLGLSLLLSRCVGGRDIFGYVVGPGGKHHLAGIDWRIQIDVQSAVRVVLRKVFVVIGCGGPFRHFVCSSNLYIDVHLLLAVRGLWDLWKRTGVERVSD